MDPSLGSSSSANQASSSSAAEGKDMIPIDFMWRGCASKSSNVPLTKKDEEDARLALVTVYYINCSKVVARRLKDLAFRDQTTDIQTRLFRWDRFDVSRIFRKGFRARAQGKTPIKSYYSVFDHVIHGGKPTATERNTTHGFIATSLCNRWIPDPLDDEKENILYRYEIFVPGGILVSATLGADDRYAEQKEVVFVDRIARRYIRCAQEFNLLTNGNGKRKWEPVENMIFCNKYFNPKIKEKIGKPDVITGYQNPNGEQKKLEEFLVSEEEEEEEVEVEEEEEEEEQEEEQEQVEAFTR